MSNATARRSELQRLLSKLKSGKAIAIAAAAIVRAELAAHISGETRPVEIAPDAWWELLNAHPPRWMSDFEFAFAEGAAPFRLTWEDRDRLFVRQLTDAETDLFCRLAAVNRNELFQPICSRYRSLVAFEAEAAIPASGGAHEIACDRLAHSAG